MVLQRGSHSLGPVLCLCCLTHPPSSQHCPVRVLLSFLLLTEFANERVPCMARHVSVISLKIIGVQSDFNCLLYYSVLAKCTCGQHCGCFLDTTDLDALTWVPAAATLSEWFRDGSSAITYWSLASWQAAPIMHINNLQWSPITSFPHDRDREMQGLWNTGLLLKIDAAGHPKGLFACSCHESIKSYTRRCFMSRHQMILCHVWWTKTSIYGNDIPVQWWSQSNSLSNLTT